MPQSHNKKNAIIIPGNGNTEISDNWYAYIKDGLYKLGLDVRARNMPDPDLARAEYWLPFIENDLKADSDSILIGHSSGATAATRFAETHKIFGLVLVGTCHTDLGLEKEKLSHYYDAPWQWHKIADNSTHIAIFASKDDPYINIDEPRHIAKKLAKAEYFEFISRGHFNDKEFPEIIEVVAKWMK